MNVCIKKTTVPGRKNCARSARVARFLAAKYGRLIRDVRQGLNLHLLLYYALTRSLQTTTVYILQHCGMYFHYVTKIVECTISSEQNVSKTLNFAGWTTPHQIRKILVFVRETGDIGTEIRELPENTGDLATLARTVKGLVYSVSISVRRTDTPLRPTRMSRCRIGERDKM